MQSLLQKCNIIILGKKKEHINYFFSKIIYMLFLSWKLLE